VKGKALNSKKLFTSGDGAVDMTQDEFCTPPEFTNPLVDFFEGPVDCDPCSNARSIVAARTAYTFGGLTRPWGGPTVGAGRGTAYSNWPYSTNLPWVTKSLLELKTQRVRELVILCMIATSTVWWSHLMRVPRRNPRVFATARIRFIGVDGTVTKDTSRFDPALIYIGPRVKRFDKHFGHLAKWSTWGR
jgi:hypothetical protein